MNNNFYNLLDESRINIRKNFDFNNKLIIGNDSPYIFNDFFNNISYNSFTYKITELITYEILNEEIIFLKKYYGKKKINNIKLSKIIKKNLDPSLVDIFIINKRLEFLLEYIEINNFNINYINYLKKILKSLYKTTIYLINQNKCIR
tara:strand:+ start:33 stop:473 length:441 start_codon:yes stop_codon:yes gene_type:complete